MKAVWYERTGPAATVLRAGERPLPEPQAGEVRVRVLVSGVNPSDVKARAVLRTPMAFPCVIPHSDGAGIIQAVGPGVGKHRIGERVWIWNAAWGRPHGTCAEFVCVPERQAVLLPDSLGFNTLGCQASRCWRQNRLDMANSCSGLVQHLRLPHLQFAGANRSRSRPEQTSVEGMALTPFAQILSLFFHRRSLFRNKYSLLFFAGNSQKNA
jgi:hypothetical protein